MSLKRYVCKTQSVGLNLQLIFKKSMRLIKKRFQKYIDSIYEEKFEDIKGVIRNRVSKKNRQQYCPNKVQKDKQRSTKHTHKTKDRVTRIPLKAGVIFPSKKYSKMWHS